MPQYLLAVHSVEGTPPPPKEELLRALADVEEFNSTLRDAGLWVFAGGLQPPDDTTVVTVRGPEVVVTDGPFAETKEQLGGFWVIRAADRDDALGWAERASRACANPVEVRPFQEEPES